MNLNDHRSLWEGEDARLTTSEELIERGIVTIEEQPELDLAVVGIPGDLAVDCHPFALHSRTRCSRMLMLQGNRVELQYRYEGWVQMASRRPAARVDLSALSAELNAEEEARRPLDFRRRRSNHAPPSSGRGDGVVDSGADDREPHRSAAPHRAAGVESLRRTVRTRRRLWRSCCAMRRPSRSAATRFADPGRATISATLTYSASEIHSLTKASGIAARYMSVESLAFRSNPEIASELTISRKTVSSHLEHIYTKIGVTTRTSAALFAMRTGLVDALVG